MGTWRIAVLMGLCLATLVLGAGCARKVQPQLGPAETFSWCGQPISFSPPPPPWYRESEVSGGLLGVRFVLGGGLGECITVAAYGSVADRDRRAALERLIARRDSMEQREFLREVSLARARTDDPLSTEDGTAATAINTALDRAVTHYLSGDREFVRLDLQDARDAASSYAPTLAGLLPRIRLRPETKQEPERWRLGYEHDTTLAGYPAFASDDTLITPERPMLYHQVFWVVNRCAFNATYQGTKPNVGIFDSLVASIRFPEHADAPAH